YCRFCPLGGFGGAEALAPLGGVEAVASAGGGALLPPPKITRLGLRSKLFTARLMSPRVRRPSAISAPERLSKSSARSRIDFTIRFSSPPAAPPAIVLRPSIRLSALPITPSTRAITLSIRSEL